MTDENGNPDQAAPETSLEDSLGAAFDKAQENAAPEGEGQTPTPAPAPAEGEAPKDNAEGDHVRDPVTGKFVKSSLVGDKGAAAADTSQPGASDPANKKVSADPSAKPEGQAPPAQAKDAPAPAASVAPVSWSAAAKEAWPSLPPAIKQEVLKREGDVQRALQSAAGDLKRLQAIDAVVQPHQRQQMAGHYGSFERGIQELLALSDFAGRTPYEFVAYFMQQRSLDPQQLFSILQRGQQPAPQQGQPQPNQAHGLNLPPSARAPQPADPRDARLAAVEQTLQFQQDQVLEGIVTAFRSEKDAAGNLLYPYFDELKDEIAARVDRGEDLKTAYTNAVWASPQHREAELEKQRQANAGVDQAAREAAAKKARQASDFASATRTNAGGNVAAPQRTIEEDLAAAFDKAQQRAA